MEARSACSGLFGECGNVLAIDAADLPDSTWHP
jgi:hypothetical protein